jgi:hypothetical protein
MATRPAPAYRPGGPGQPAASSGVISVPRFRREQAVQAEFRLAAAGGDAPGPRHRDGRAEFGEFGQVVTASGKIQRGLCATMFEAGHLAEVGRDAIGGSCDGPTQVERASLLAAPQETRRHLLGEYLGGLIASACGMTPEQVTGVPLLALGIDSYATVSIQHSIQKDLEAHVTAADLAHAGYLLSCTKENIDRATRNFRRNPIAGAGEPGLLCSQESVMISPPSGSARATVKWLPRGGNDGSDDTRRGFPYGRREHRRNLE